MSEELTKGLRFAEEAFDEAIEEKESTIADLRRQVNARNWRTAICVNASCFFTTEHIPLWLWKERIVCNCATFFVDFSSILGGMN